MPERVGLDIYTWLVDYKGQVAALRIMMQGATYLYICFRSMLRLLFWIVEGKYVFQTKPHISTCALDNYVGCGVRQYILHWAGVAPSKHSRTLGRFYA
jgi:hypothetical protein